MASPLTLTLTSPSPSPSTSPSTLTLTSTSTLCGELLLVDDALAGCTESFLATRSLTHRLIELGKRVQDSLETRSHPLALDPSRAPLAKEGPEPPVVARLVVEIRSDGTRTVARGAIEDLATNQRVAVEAHGTTPAELAASLAKSMFSMPALAAAAIRAVIGGPPPPDDREKP